MAGISITVDASQLEAVTQRLVRRSQVGAVELMTAIGAIGESQTRRRITEEKTGPDGQAWPPNRRGGDILVETGQHLLGSVAYRASAEEAEWGASWEFAHVHQNGATIVPKTKKRLSFMLGGKLVHAHKVTIPARPFVGLSAENRREIEDLVTDWLGRLMA
ncbi:phage virion morphogenesis protein [Prosthecomicrobium hirschii]|uniref:phage virion morphogenesis protein n=2 Tax=Prosthecodimorpha hirschii TaxID=665126 RepID=UPI00221F9FD9|nr:phage virion morphogenesis protein [Prosthecomicrobium hirschii]MCW1842297.1 phage virion morphogenesis protein [Prosthecomicrobium hirschii]